MLVRAPGARRGGVAVAELDGDGKHDLVVASETNDHLIVLLQR